MTRRLVVGYLAITTFVLAILGIPLGVFFERQQIDGLMTDLERDATVLATIYEDALQDDLVADPQPALDYQDRTGARVVVVDDAGISIIDTEAAEDRDLGTRPEIEEALAGVHATGSRFSTSLDTELAFAAVPVASGGVVFGAVRVTFESDQVRQRVNRFWWGLGATSAVVIVAVAGAGWVMARSISRPLRELQGTAERFAAGDLATTTPSEKLPELAALETAMNTMAAELDNLIQRQRRFVADASHQLRTPLTALRLRLENVEAGVQASGLDGDAEELGRAIDETDRLARLIQDLLRLATANQPRDAERIDLSGIVRDRVDTWTAIAEESEVALDAVFEDGELSCLMAPGALEQILDNLLENAIRVSPAASVIRVRVRRAFGFARVDVSDEGPGLTDEEKDVATDRFWRGDPTTEGTGLGLAIVVQLVLASGGAFVLEDNEPTGLTASFTVPL
ncbi:MAG: HAMP domain-containing sensor histidine kinase [Acidimicrobiales bacterium]